MRKIKVKKHQVCMCEYVHVHSIAGLLDLLCFHCVYYLDLALCNLVLILRLNTVNTLNTSYTVSLLKDVMETDEAAKVREVKVIHGLSHEQKISITR